MRHPSPRVGGTAGLVAICLLVMALSILTIVQASFLSDSGWSPVHRSPTEWPSIMANGPGGWILCVVFAICGCAALMLASSLMSSGEGDRGGSSERMLAVAAGLVGAGLVGVAFPVDQGFNSTSSWHEAVHNRAYFLIPAGTLLAAVTIACARLPRLRLGSGWRAALLVVLVLSFALTNVDEIAQLARYFAFSACFAIIGCVAAVALEHNRGETATRAAAEH